MRITIAEEITKTGQPDLLIYLNITPDAAVQRIENRIKKENQEIGLVRPKWKHMHENPKDLELLKKEYEKILKHYDQLGWNIHVLDVEKLSQNEIIDNVEMLVREELSDK